MHALLYGNVSTAPAHAYDACTCQVWMLAVIALLTHISEEWTVW